MADVTPAAPGAAVSVVWTDEPGSAGAATELLRSEVGRCLGILATQVRLTRSCAQCGSSEHGRPVVLSGAGRTPFVSLSRAGDLVVVAVSEGSPVGVDVERLDALRFAGFDDVALHRYEIAPSIEARAATWVRKESLLKATGDALHLDPRLIRLSDPDLPPQLVEWSAPNPPKLGVWMCDLDIRAHAACVTVLAEEAPRLTLRQAAREDPAR